MERWLVLVLIIGILLNNNEKLFYIFYIGKKFKFDNCKF